MAHNVFQGLCFWKGLFLIPLNLPLEKGDLKVLGNSPLFLSPLHVLMWSYPEWRGTTAAEPFFGEKPRDLFEYLLDRLDLPGRPAQKRSQPEQEKYFESKIAQFSAW